VNASQLSLLVACLLVSASASAQTLTCSSDDMGRHFCRANTSNGVQMLRQRSGSPCTQGYSWGYDSGGIWVDHGCRADFSLAGGGRPGGTSPQDAQRYCKNTAGERLPGVPLAYISVYRGSDTGDGNYMINFRAQPPNNRVASGFCIISKSGQLVRFQFDPNSGPSPGGGAFGGISPQDAIRSDGNSAQDAMRSCKNTVSGHIPNVPLAYIHINQTSAIGGGGYMVNFHAPNFHGFCNVYRNRPVELWSGGRRLQ
jgi:Protein of unknown function (DUF3011)